MIHPKRYYKESNATGRKRENYWGNVICENDEVYVSVDERSDWWK